MPDFRVGLSGCGGGLESVSSSQILDLADAAERLGFDGLWLNEEHFQGSMPETEGRRCLSPLILAAAILGRTTKLRIGFSVLLLGLHNPLRLAEDIASLDVLSEGRVDFGVSRGGNQRYLPAFAESQERTRDGFQVSLERVLEAWTQNTISVAGTSVSIQPKPVQQPHPPVYVGTYTEETCAWAARRGFSIMIHGIGNLSYCRRLMTCFASEGGAPAHVPFGRFIYVSDSDENARRELRPVVLKLTTRLRNVGLRSNILTPDDLEPERFYREMVIAGGPDTCAGGILGLKSELGVGYLNALSAFFGFLPLPLLNSSLRLLAEEVRPRLHR